MKGVQGVLDGKVVLVTGASGGVGLAAVQLALLRGAVVTGQCSLGKSAVVRAAGASVLDRSTPLKPHSFDVVIDVVGGDLHRLVVAAPTTIAPGVNSKPRSPSGPARDSSR